MRLIDADALPEVDSIERIEGDRGVFVTTWIPAEAIWKAPTVEAIPIEWMNKWLSKFYKEINGRTYYMGDGYDSVQDMLDDWEKENDQL